MADTKENKTLEGVVKYGGSAGLGAVVFSLLMELQSQGINSVKEGQMLSQNMLIQKTEANTNRIDKLEADIEKISKKMDEGFNALRIQNSEGTNKILDIIRDNTAHRYTRLDHDNYAKSVNVRFERLEDKISEVKSDLIEHITKTKKTQ